METHGTSNPAYAGSSPVGHAKILFEKLEKFCYNIYIKKWKRGSDNERIENAKRLGTYWN